MATTGIKPCKKPVVFYGETSCQGKHASGKNEGKMCSNKAYYTQGGRYLCGVHSRIEKRTKLRKNPDASKIREKKLKGHEGTVDVTRAANRKDGLPGKVICSKMGMRRAPEEVGGFLKVFPNYKHQGRKDGFGCASLSPMKLGPVEHKQKGLPSCKLLENYHQFNKVYNTEVDKEKKPLQSFYKAQIKGYKSSTGQRHKFTGKSKIPGKGTYERPKTLYSIHTDCDGKEKKYTYVNSRYFYCHFYEELVQGNKDLEKLKSKITDGTNIQLVGYDGYNVTKDLMHHYVDASRPFGHEMVLYTLLTVEDPKQYPWNKYYEMNQDLYPSEHKPSYIAAKKCPEGKADEKRTEGKDDEKRTEGKADEKRIESKADEKRTEGKADEKRTDLKEEAETSESDDSDVDMKDEAV